MMAHAPGIAHAGSGNDDLRRFIEIDRLGFIARDRKAQPGNVMGLIPCLTSSIASSSKQVRSFCLKIPVASTASGLST